MLKVIIGRSFWMDGIKFSAWEPDEFWVVLDTSKPSQHRSSTAYVNRQMTNQNRTRGDVGVA